MSLKKQFIMLIIGILIIPSLTVTLAVNIFQATNNSAARVFGLRNDSRLIEAWLATDQSQPLTGLENDNIFILKGQEVIFGDPSYSIDAEQLIQQNDFLSLGFEANQQPYTVLFLFDKRSWNLNDGIPWVGIMVPLILLTFLSLMVVWILRTLQLKLQKLNKIIGGIGDGDLTTPIPISDNGELAPVERSLESMRVQLLQAGESRKRLLMGISHDLKTPLTGIKGYVQAIRDGLAESPEQQQHYLAIIDDKTRLLERRIASLIEFVKLETSDWKVRALSNDIQPLAAQWFDEFTNDLSVAGRVCYIENRLTHPTFATVDAELVRRALDNLVSNAMKYSPAGTAITITSQTDQQHLTFNVISDGEPFATADLDKLFTPFYRGDAGRNTEGMGLGLALVEKIATLHGGHASYERCNNQHCFRFTVALAA